MTTSPSVLSRRLCDGLADRGQVRQQWAAALHAVPRHAFVPETIYRHERDRGGNDLVPVRRAEQPDEWLNLVYADQPVNTQVNNGRPESDGTGREVTSSSSQPTVVAQMLDELSPRPGERILEIGRSELDRPHRDGENWGLVYLRSDHHRQSRVLVHPFGAVAGIRPTASAGPQAGGHGARPKTARECGRVNVAA